ncbi:hypothetical protein [Streptomyces sp. UH6]|uniref:hypothetical protein n=1 Tax=Streptomyces sp. UH6 TaxID=2748379 RepID=UPI0015D476D0|nr:hypothetical protein [Streptomyces sp. UH6]NYV73470.1 hypothetical protein [Streptomyces sp. UH6]
MTDPDREREASMTTRGTIPPQDDARAARRRRMTAVRWLLSAASEPEHAGQTWPAEGTLLLRCGRSFTTVRMPGRVVEAAAGTSCPEGLAAFLGARTEGGGVWADRHNGGVYFLVPVGACLDWSVPGTECLDSRSFVGVPHPGLGVREGERTYWLVEVDGPGALCPVDAVAAIARQGAKALTGADSVVFAVDLGPVRQAAAQALELTSGLPGTLPDPVRMVPVTAGLRAEVGVLAERMQRFLAGEADGSGEPDRSDRETAHWLLQRVRHRLDHRMDADDRASATALEALALDARALAELYERHCRG